MINPIFTPSEYFDDDNDDNGFSLTWSPTDDERQRIEEYQEYSLQSQFIFPYDLEDGPSVVLDGFLFLGSLRHGSNLELIERMKIEHIINVSDSDVSKKFPPNRLDIVYLPMDDSVRTNIKQHFDRTNELLHSYYIKNERCLVHCAAGISRSATIVLAYLMKYHHNTLKDAYVHLVEKRPRIFPNDGFLLQLLRYENELIESREIVTTSETNGASTNTIHNPIETLEQFEKKEDEQTVANNKSVKPVTRK